MNLERFAHLPLAERQKLAKFFQRAAILSRPGPRPPAPEASTNEKEPNK